MSSATKEEALEKLRLCYKIQKEGKRILKANHGKSIRFIPEKIRKENVLK